MNPGKAPARASDTVPNPPAVRLRSVDIYAADLHDGRHRLVEPHESADRWLEIDSQHLFELEDLE